MDDKKTRFIGLKRNSRGRTDAFRCEQCGCEIYVDWDVKELDYNYCPWCGAERQGCDKNNENNEHRYVLS